MNVSPPGSGNITSPQFTDNPTTYPTSYTCSTDYTLTAVPDANAGYEFVEWAVNAATETVNPLAISVADGAKNVTAFFRITGTGNNPPTADAGADRSVVEGSQVALDGSGSSDPDNDIRSYTWTQIEGTVVALVNPTTVSPMFLAPAVVSGETVTLTFQLTVEDLSGLSDTDTVTITVYDSGAPTADAGEDQTVTQRSEVTLDGTGSFDPDNNISSYSWQQTEGADVTLNDPSLARPKFTAPEVSLDPIILVFQLTVADATGLTDVATVTITVVRGQVGGTSSSAGCFISGAVQ